MANTEQFLSAGIGALVGFIIGGPAGAFAGFQYGLLAGALLFPAEQPAVQGPRLEDIERADAEPGSPVFKVYGRMAVPGFRMYLGRVLQASSTEEVGGKGGGGQDVTTYSYSQTVVLGLCEGPIASVQRIWENGALKYDSRPQQIGESLASYQARIVASNDYDDSFSLYIGTEDQTADSTLQTELGSANVPAFRGLAYMVYPFRAISDDQGRRHPVWKIEVNQRGEAALVIVGDEIAAYSLDGGDTWLNASVGPTSGAFDEGSLGTVCHDSTRNRFVALGAGDSIWYSDDNGDTWTQVASAVTSGGSNPFLHSFYHFDSDTIWAARSGGGTGSGSDKVWYSEDGGLTWTGIDFVTEFGISDSNWVAGMMVIDETDQFVIAFGGAGANLYVYEVDIADAKTIGNWTEHNVTGDISNIWDQGDGHPRGMAYQSNSQRLLVGLAEGSSFEEGSVAYSAVGDFSSWNETDAGTQNNSDCVSVSYIPASNRLVAAFTHSVNNEHLAWTTTPETSWAAVSAGVQPSRLWNNGHYFAPHELVFVCGNGYIARTPDGATWEEVAHTGDWRDIASGAEADGVPASTLVTDILAEVGLTNLDTTEIALDVIIGYAITRQVTARGALDPIRTFCQFDYVESGEQLVFRKRGGASVATLTTTDLGAVLTNRTQDTSGKRPPAITTRKVQEFELPRQVRLRYLSLTKDYQKSETLSPARIGTVGVKDLTMELPLALDDTLAAQLAEVVFRDAWSSRYQHEFSLDQSWAKLEVADPILVPVDGRNYRMRITQIADQALGVRKITAVRDDDGAYVSVAAAVSVSQEGQAIALLSATSYQILDLPALEETQDDAHMLVGAWATDADGNWPGATLHRSPDAGETYSAIAAMAAQATVGEVVTAPSGGQTFTWNDPAVELVVDILNGRTLASATDAAVLAGSNALAVGADGRWCIVQFADVELVSTGRYKLTRLLLGRRGTEQHLDSITAMDRCVLISGPGIYEIPIQNSNIGFDYVYRAVTQTATFASGSDATFPGSGERLEPFSPVRIRGARDGSDNLTITWLRRDRLSETLRDNMAVPMSEGSELYDVEILDGMTVVRTFTDVASETQAYSAAEQTTDFGSPQSAIAVRIYQKSTVVGRGAPGEATI